MKIFAKNQCGEPLAEVLLKPGFAPSPFDPKSKAVPRNGGYELYLERGEAEDFKEAARIVASLGVYKLSLDPGAFSFDEKRAQAFALSMYDGIHDIVLSLPLDTLKVLELEKQVNLICSFREIADSDSKLATPRALILELFGKIKSAAELKGGKATLQMISRGDQDFDRLVGLKAVGLASDNDPALGVIDFLPEECGEDVRVEVALVGKGITFDSGGYSLKPPKFMETMRTDKTAAVYLAGSLCLAIVQGLARRVRLFLCCAENLISSKALLPGDVIRYENGVSVEINNTDAEGRLVLADGLIKAAECRPDIILDMATLTGAAKIALGRDMFAVFSNDNVLPPRLKAAFDNAGEAYWQLPLCDFHRRFLSSRRATVTNSGHGDSVPGASAAASFLRLFVKPSQRWVHIDLASAYLPDGSPFLAPGPTGCGIVGIAKWLCGSEL